MKFSVKEHLKKIEEYFDGTKSHGRRLILVYKIHDSEENNGVWTIRIENDTCVLSEGESEDYDVKMLMTAETYERLVTGKLPIGYLSYFNGDIRYMGKMLALEELQTFLNIPGGSGIVSL